MYEWSDLRIFLAVVRAGSALGAAKVLGINHSTVNRRIQTLEHGLRLQLFDRKSRGHKLTERGAALVSAAEAVETSAVDLKSTAERLSRLVAGVVRVTAPEAVATQIIIPIAAEFQQVHCDVRVEQMAADTRLDIVHGEADVAFRVGDHPSDPRLIGQRLPDLIWGVYCSVDYANANGMPENSAAIRQHDIVNFAESLRGFGPRKWLLDQADHARITGAANTVPNMRAVLRSGLGVGVLPRFFGDADPGLICCFDTPNEVSAEFWLLTSPEARSSPQVRVFIDFAVPRVVALRSVFSGAALGQSGASPSGREGGD